MDIHTLPTALPFILIIDDDQRQASQELATMLIEARLDFAYISPDPDLLAPEIKERWIDNPIDLQKNAGIIIDMTWSVLISEETLVYMDDRGLDHGALVLTTSVSEPTGSATAIFPEINIVGFNGLPGFFPANKTLELAPPRGADPEAVTTAKRFFRALGFEIEEIEDRPGYVLPRIICMIINEAAFCVMEGVATAEDIDTAMKLGTNYPKGPLAWADEIGLEVVSGLLTMLEAEYRQERYRPCQLLQQMVRANELGIESGSGFYDYTATQS